ncbi:MAG: GFA family protein [Deltaproteobacteria bacterium]|nr:GFA family protein [Deltaproteobacteria bacterium]
MSSNERARGSCFCGEVRFTVALPSLVSAHCHCTMCRKLHGAAFVTWFTLPREQFALETSEAGLVRYSSSDHASRSSCGQCGTPLFYESDERPGQVDVVLASMEEPIDREPQMHIFFDDRAAWSVVDDGLPRLGGATGIEPLESEDRPST